MLQLPSNRSVVATSLCGWNWLVPLYVSRSTLLWSSSCTFSRARYTKLGCEYIDPALELFLTPFSALLAFQRSLGMDGRESHCGPLLPLQMRALRKARRTLSLFVILRRSFLWGTVLHRTHNGSEPLAIIALGCQYMRTYTEG